ncbi:hypothetical protein EVAR_87789_1 [Eumeta japonica]|uniref:Uncharacterized protein n=1 Tax=Eumeta variegata TaxID=151549 RepID=A0A4C1X3C1_EUMVA|nr:hypothetical protein EVAR_87789_1 [Eumeta japonica]
MRWRVRVHYNGKQNVESSRRRRGSMTRDHKKCARAARAALPLALARLGEKARFEPFDLEYIGRGRYGSVVKWQVLETTTTRSVSHSTVLACDPTARQRPTPIRLRSPFLVSRDPPMKSREYILIEHQSVDGTSILVGHELVSQMRTSGYLMGKNAIKQANTGGTNDGYANTMMAVALGRRCLMAQTFGSVKRTSCTSSRLTARCVSDGMAGIASVGSLNTPDTLLDVTVCNYIHKGCPMWAQFQK